MTTPELDGGGSLGIVTVTRRRARKGEGDRLRAEILEAAELLLLETGSEDGVSIRAVADATGVTAPSIYRHFTDKTHLLFEVCARHFALLDDVIEAACAGIDDPIAAMQARGRAYVRYGVDHPEHYRIMFMGPAHATPDQWNDLLDTGPFAHLVEGLQAGIDAGVLSCSPRRDVRAMAMHVWANIHGLTSLLVARPTMPWPELDDFVDEHLALCMRAHLPQ
ncbi:MAG: TetR/AcrR family transcriptional regulator [Acidimicrobiales bacterium]